jgi:hypothetical protein
MYVGKDFLSIDPGETESFSLDFVRDLQEGETITLGSAVFFVELVKGQDPAPDSRKLGSCTINGTAVSQRIGNCVSGCRYRLRAQVQTSNMNTLSIWSHVQCGPLS